MTTRKQLRHEVRSANVQIMRKGCSHASDLATKSTTDFICFRVRALHPTDDTPIVVLLAFFQTRRPRLEFYSSFYNIALCTPHQRVAKCSKIKVLKKEAHDSRSLFLKQGVRPVLGDLAVSFRLALLDLAVGFGAVVALLLGEVLLSFESGHAAGTYENVSETTNSK